MLPATATAWVAVVLLAGITALSAAWTVARRRLPLWLTVVYVAVLLIGFLAWASAGERFR